MSRLIEVYVDAGWKNNLARCAFNIYINGVLEKKKTFTLNFANDSTEAELMGIARVIKFVSNRLSKKDELIVYCDNRSAIEFLNDIVAPKRNSSHETIYQAIKHKMRGYKTNFVHVGERSKNAFHSMNIVDCDLRLKGIEQYYILTRRGGFVQCKTTPQKMFAYLVKKAYKHLKNLGPKDIFKLKKQVYNLHCVNVGS